MNKQDILVLYRYNQWANERILGAAARVTQEQFVAPAPFPHGGLRSTLVHALSAEWIWRTRWEGSSPTSLLKPEQFPDFAALQERWMEEERRLMKFVSDFPEERLNSTFDYRNTAGQPFTKVLWHVMAHVVNHGTQHRAEVAAMLTEFGHSPGDMDLVLFVP